jgi:hypothetical protein
MQKRAAYAALFLSLIISAVAAFCRGVEFTIDEKA